MLYFASQNEKKNFFNWPHVLENTDPVMASLAWSKNN